MTRLVKNACIVGLTKIYRPLAFSLGRKAQSWSSRKLSTIKPRQRVTRRRRIVVTSPARSKQVIVGDIPEAHENIRLYKSIVATTAAQGYRPDLRREAVARGSAVRRSLRPVKQTPERKPRGAKARKA